MWEITVELPDGKLLTHRYAPTPQQEAFHRSKARYVLFGGAVGPGKSHALCEHILARMLRTPGIPVLLLRRDLRDLRRSTEQTWRKVCPPELYSARYGGQHNKNENYYRFANGSILYLGEAKDWQSYKSVEVGLIAIDELNEVDEEVYINLDTRLRWTTGDGLCTLQSCHQYGVDHPAHPRYQIVAATNPATGWVRRRWYDPWKAGQQLPQHEFIPATTFDNPHLPADYISSLLESHTAEWVRNYIYGDWSSFEGQVWPNISRATHAWPSSRPLPPFIHVDGGIDWGALSAAVPARTVALVGGLDPERRVIVFEMFSQKGAASEAVFDWVAKMTKRYGVRRWYADSSQTRANQLLRERGLPVFDARRTPGAVADDIALIERWAAEGRLLIAEQLERLWSGIESYRYGDDGKPAKHQEDDEVDAFRYLMQSITVGVGKTAPSRVKADERYIVGRPREKMSPFLAAIRAERSKTYETLLRELNAKTS